MDEIFANIGLANGKRLCIGVVTRKEAAEASALGAPISDSGVYLFLADDRSPDEPIEILARFLTLELAERAASVFSASSKVNPSELRWDDSVVQFSQKSIT